ncbi:hypothetical protein NL676_001309 [Syzygium grande]|nr:hypothetical protein NL676_001309 [Syzygium grande]
MIVRERISSVGWMIILRHRSCSYASGAWESFGEDQDGHRRESDRLGPAGGGPGPSLVWPLYLEQQSNAFEMSRELVSSVEIRIDYRTDLRRETESMVRADEIERGLKRFDGKRK